MPQRSRMARMALTLPLVTVLAGPVLAQDATAPASTAPASTAVRVRSGQQPDHGRVVFHLGTIPGVVLRKNTNSYDLRLQGSYELDLSGLRPLQELVSITSRRDGAETVVTLTMTCDCQAETASGEGMLWVNLRPPASSTTTAAATQALSPAQQRREARRIAAEEVARRRALDDAVRLGLMTRRQADAMLAAAAQPDTPPQAVASAPQADEAAQLRQSLLQQLGELTKPPRPATAPAAAATTSPGQRAAAHPAPAAVQPTAGRLAAAPPRPKPACPPSFDMSGWGGPADAPFVERLSELRRALAASDEAAEPAAELAEYLIGQGLVHEALDLLAGRINDDLAEAMRLRLQRARDIARLLRQLQIDTGSPLLAVSENCDREDLGLWQALAAAGAGDTGTVVRLAPRARAALRDVPDRLRFAFAFVLADAAGDDLEALRGLAAPIRGSMPQTEAELAGRSWLMARIAGLEGSREEERLHLERAASARHTVPGLFASARLAAADAAEPSSVSAGRTPGEATSAAMQQAEARLIDFARTYRFDALGEEAAVLFARLMLTRGDLPGALIAADSASQSGGRPGLASRGASLAGQVLRLMLVDPAGKPQPPAEEKLALYWQYEGYATPGERGDDIRLGAARLMLEQGLAESALDTARQVTPATAQAPATMLLTARAEVAAVHGDPQRGLAMVRSLPATPEIRRVAATALARLGRPADAARELDGMRDPADLTARANYLYSAQSWPEAMAAYAEVLRLPNLDAAVRADASSRYVSAAALSPQRAAMVPRELLALGDAGSRALLILASEAAPAAAAGRPRMDTVRGAIDRAKRIEALLAAPATPGETR